MPMHWGAVSLFNFQLDSNTMLFAGAIFALSAVVVSFNEKPTLAVLSGGIAVTLSSAASIIMRIEASLDIF